MPASSTSPSTERVVMDVGGVAVSDCHVSIKFRIFNYRCVVLYIRFFFFRGLVLL